MQYRLNNFLQSLLLIP